MAWKVQTTDGVLVKTGDMMTEKGAEASAQERNARAEKMGLKVRYEAVER